SVLRPAARAEAHDAVLRGLGTAGPVLLDVLHGAHRRAAGPLGRVHHDGVVAARQVEPAAVVHAATATAADLDRLAGLGVGVLLLPLAVHPLGLAADAHVPGLHLAVVRPEGLVHDAGLHQSELLARQLAGALVLAAGV